MDRWIYGPMGDGQQVVAIVGCHYNCIQGQCYWLLAVGNQEMTLHEVKTFKEPS